MSGAGEVRSSHEVGPDDAGMRLDRFCAVRHPERSRTQLAKLIKDGLVLVDGVPAKPGLVVEAGWSIEIVLPPEADAPTRVAAEAIPVAIVFEDDDLLLVEKPAGLVVHPGAGVRTGTLVAALLHHRPQLAGVGGEGRAGIVHRLDRGTSGLLLVAKSSAMHRALQDLFRARSVQKHYRAFVWGRPREESGTIDLPIGRDPRVRVRMSARAINAREALTAWRVLEEAPGFASLDVRIHTGRTHQIRVHLQAIGHPIVGDETYGGDRARSIADVRLRKAVRAFARPALHAERLAFDHPRTGEALAFTSPLPADMTALWSAIRAGVVRP